MFPHTTLWLIGGYLLLDGGLAPLQLDWSTFQQRFNAMPPTEHSNAADFLSMFIAAGTPVWQWAAAAPQNTDNNAFIEYRAPRAFASLNSTALAVHNLQALMPLHRPVTDLFTVLPVPAREQLRHGTQATRLIWEGMIARLQGQTDQARDLYARAHTLNPTNYQIRRFVAQDLAAQGRRALLNGRLTHAAPLLRRALRLNAHNTDAQFDLALVHAKQGEHTAAVSLLRRLVHAHPTFLHGRFNLGLSLYYLRRYPDAAAQFTHMVQHTPGHTDALFNLANSLAQAGAHQAALYWYQRTLTQEPTHRLARDNLRALQSWLAAQRRQ